MTSPRGTQIGWTSPTIVLTVAAMILTAYSSYGATQTGIEVRIAKIEYRLDQIEHRMTTAEMVQDKRSDAIAAIDSRLDRIEAKR